MNNVVYSLDKKELLHELQMFVKLSFFLVYSYSLDLSKFIQMHKAFKTKKFYLADCWKNTCNLSGRKKRERERESQRESFKTFAKQSYVRGTATHVVCYDSHMHCYNVSMQEIFFKYLHVHSQASGTLSKLHSKLCLLHTRE